MAVGYGVTGVATITDGLRVGSGGSSHIVGGYYRFGSDLVGIFERKMDIQWNI